VGDTGRSRIPDLNRTGEYERAADTPLVVMDRAELAQWLALQTPKKPARGSAKRPSTEAPAKKTPPAPRGQRRPRSDPRRRSKG
jgi:hypothetical protein